MSKFNAALDSVPGWLRKGEQRLLFELARAVTGKGVIVEIGSHKGRSTVALAAGSKAGNRARVHAIDPQSDDYALQLKRNLSSFQLQDIVTVIRENSQDAALNFSQPVELLFIDGDHSLQGINSDFELWLPKLIPNGVVAVHDSLGRFPAVAKVVNQQLFRSKQFSKLGFVWSTSYGKKFESLSWLQKVSNALVYLIKLLAETGLKTVLLFKKMLRSLMRPSVAF